MNFQEADRRYIELKRQYDNGDLSDQEFRTQLEQIAVQDGEGRWWAKHRDTGEWYYQHGDTWVQGIPPYPPYYKPGSSGDKTDGVAPGTESGASSETGSGGRNFTVHETPDWRIPDWRILLGIVSAVAGLMFSRVSYFTSVTLLLALLLPGVGFYLGDIARRRGHAIGGNVTKILGVVCLILVLLRIASFFYAPS